MRSTPRGSTTLARVSATSTVRRFEIELADSDRDLYATLDLRTAQHPSESDRYLVARVLETGAASILQLNLGRVGGARCACSQ